MAKQRLSRGQLERASEILGNLAVAWFSAGIISPLFIYPKDILVFILNFGVSLIMATFFAIWSMRLVKDIK